MKWITHVSCILILLAGLSRFTPLTLGFILLSLAGSILPDLIEEWTGLPHRSVFTHNIVIGVLLLILPSGLNALGVGYLHHLALDALTPGGVYVFTRRVRGPLESSSIPYNMVVVLAHLLLALTVLVS